ncbi:hypothetical protein D9M72_210350 [compost metagenome]
MGDRCPHGISAFAGQFRHHIRRVVDVVGVIADSADHRVRSRRAAEGVIAGATIQDVVGGIPCQNVVKRIARAVDGRGSSEREVLDIGAKCVADAALNDVSSLIDKFGHQIGNVINKVDVVPRTTSERVDAGAAVERVVTCATEQSVVCSIPRKQVVQSVSCSIDCLCAGQGQILEVHTQRVGDGALHQIGPLVCEFGDRIACVVDNIDIVACTTDQRVRPACAIEHIARRTARELVVVGAASEVFDLHKRVAAGAARSLRRGHGKAGSDAGERVLIGDRVDAAQSIEHVVAAPREEDIVCRIAGSVDGGGTSEEQVLEVRA